VLVTGAGGFTGAALVRHLLSEGHPVRALVRNREHVSGLAQAGAEVRVGDVRDRDTIAQAVQGVHTVYHLAAVFRQAGVQESEYRTVHVDATRQLVQYSAAAGVSRFLHCSTVGVHGDVDRAEPATEDAPLLPGDIYQLTKLEGEDVARETAARTGLPLTVVRPGPIYGPGDRRLFKLIGGVARRRFVLVGDGTPRFQMVYVDDLAKGFHLAAMTPNAIGRTYIITGNEAPTLNELVHEIAEVARVPALPWHLPVWPFWVAGAVCEALCVPFGIEPPIFRRRVKFFTNNRWFDTSRARRELGYVPGIPLHDGLRLTLNSYRQLGWI
jgi:nucleoside-diphosphate-sugar epimerase